MNDAVNSRRIEPLDKWIKEAWHIRFGVEWYFKESATNAYTVRVNLIIQEIKRTAKGFRNIQNPY
jgi:transposase